MLIILFLFDDCEASFVISDIVTQTKARFFPQQTETTFF